MMIHSVKAFLSLILYYAGIVWLFQKFNEKILNQKGVQILAFHRVHNPSNSVIDMEVEPGSFDQMIQYLKKSYRIVSLEKAVDLLLNNKCYRDTKTLVITFDDGYRDNYEFAFPILRSHRVPAAIFISVNHIQNNEPLWWDKIIYALLHTSEHLLDLTQFGLSRYPLQSAWQKKVAASALISALKRMGYRDREKIIDHLLSELRINLTKNRSSLPELLSWKEVRELKENGTTIGTHGLTHTILTHVSQPELKTEISESKQTIESNLKGKIEFFSYPNGGYDDYNDTVVREVKDAGYKAACTLIPGVNTCFNGRSSNSMFELRRRLVTRDMYTGFKGCFSVALLATELSGLFDILFMRNTRITKKNRKTHLVNSIETNES